LTPAASLDFLHLDEVADARARADRAEPARTCAHGPTYAKSPIELSTTTLSATTTCSPIVAFCRRAFGPISLCAPMRERRPIVVLGRIVTSLAKVEIGFEIGRRGSRS
jgi:nucleoside-diphosphate-sugar epimerase